MTVWRRLRGFVGTVLTWAGIGAAIGFLVFLVRYDAWRLPWATAEQLRRWLRLLAMWESAAALWGAVGGLTFSLAVWVGAKTNDPNRLTRRRMLLWGALAGAALPVGLYALHLLRGATLYSPVLFMVGGLSALAGAGVGAAIHRLLRRAVRPTERPVEGLLNAPLVDPVAASHVREHVR